MFEAGPSLGGRVSSFYDPETQTMLDNCGHVILGCCSEAKQFLARIGSLEQVEFHDTLNLISPAVDEATAEGSHCGRQSRLAINASLLPAPIHLLPSILRTPYLSRAQKANVLKLLGSMLFIRPRDAATALQYLKSLGCSKALLERLIDPMVISALNESAGEASAKYARMVIVESLLKGRGSYRLGVFKAPQSQLIGEAALRWLTEHDSQVHLSSRVRKVRIQDGQLSAVELASGHVVEFAACVAAVPPMALQKLGLDPGKGHALRWRPIISAHLFYKGSIPRFEPAYVVGEPFGWVFSKHTDSGHAEAVASAAEDIFHLETSELLSMAFRAAAAAEPVLAMIPRRRGLIYRAHRATFATLGCDADRPQTLGKTRNLFLAGDWTATGWPATIEGAVRSGMAAASGVLQVI